ncbi:unnamed protein product [Blepharisma stoltei]|uniref:non-specific serine/threonine protein kinase n=1 Tax=Blepharisma stoltei TaxID=1481888 RepID=A0AAU9JSH5_9CILI|nr:unnamed protein product [Blepharisma stoltei]
MGCPCFKSEESSEQVSLIQKESPSLSRESTSVSDLKLSPDDFQMVKMLGKGSFGKVILVLKKGTEKYYAMKVLKKSVIKEKDQISHTLNERMILEDVRCPFIVPLRFSFQTDEKLYMVMEYMSGGELFFHLKKSGRFTEARARFYAAEIILALECLHSKGIVYRDLKPENVLLGLDGHIKLTDFGLSKMGLSLENPKTYTCCGTPEYLAPEIIKNEGHGQAVDFWGLGVLLYEMISGTAPFWAKTRDEMYHNVLHNEVDMKLYFSKAAKDLLSKLLQVDPNKRLANFKEIKEHAFFKGIDWDAYMRKSVNAPFKPRIANSVDLRNFDAQFTNEPAGDSLETKGVIEGHKFPGFTYTDPNYLA